MVWTCGNDILSRSIDGRARLNRFKITISPPITFKPYQVCYKYYIEYSTSIFPKKTASLACFSHRSCTARSAARSNKAQTVSKEKTCSTIFSPITRAPRAQWRENPGSPVLVEGIMVKSKPKPCLCHAHGCVERSVRITLAHKPIPNTHAHDKKSTFDRPLFPHIHI